MKIISVSRGFTADHSSTSYEFLAVDRPLNAAQREAVSSLSSRCSPGPRRVNFVYGVDGYDIPGGWLPLLKGYYDVMYSESYDWWMLVMAFPTTMEEGKMLERYEFSDINELGTRVFAGDKRTIVAVHCRLSSLALFNNDGDYYEEMVDGEDEGDPAGAGGDRLLRLLVKIREQLMDGDYRSLYAVWKVYGEAEIDDEEELMAPPKPPDQEKGADIVEEFFSLLESI